MSKQVQFRRGTTAEHAAFTGAVGELTVDTTKKTVVVHDGVTRGGHPVPTDAGYLWREAAGNPVQVYPVPGGPLHVQVSGQYTQEGSGDPSPDSVRALIPWMASGTVATIAQAGGATIALTAPAAIWDGYLNNDGVAHDEFACIQSPTITDGVTSLGTVLRFRVSGLSLGSSPSIASSHFPYALDYSGDYEHYYFLSGNLWVFVKISRLSAATIAGVNAWIAAQTAASTPVQFLYRPAAAVEHEITAAPLLALEQTDRLTKRLNTITSDVDTLTVTYARFAEWEPKDYATILLDEAVKKRGHYPTNDLINIRDSARFPSGKGLVSLRFDDNDLTFYSNAYPLLLARGMPATLSFVSNRIGAFPERDKCSDAQIIEMCRHGFELACHSHTHASTDPVEAGDIQREVSDARDSWESGTGFSVRTFVQPGTWPTHMTDMGSDLGLAIQKCYTFYEGYYGPQFKARPNKLIYGSNHYTIDGLSAASMQWFADQVAGKNLAVTLLTHAVYADFTGDTFTSHSDIAAFETFLDHLVALRDAGLIDVVTDAACCGAGIGEPVNQLSNGGFEDSFAGFTTVGTPTITETDYHEIIVYEDWGEM